MKIKKRLFILMISLLVISSLMSLDTLGPGYWRDIYPLINGNFIELEDNLSKKYDTVSAAEAATGYTDNDRCYVVETETFYRYESAGSAYTDDNTFVLSTANGGDTRWLGIAGYYVLGDTEIDGIKLTTTDATVTTISTLTLPDNVRYSIEIKVLAMESDASDGNYYHLEGLFYRNGGNATQQGGEVATQSIYTLESAAAADCVFAVNGNDVRINVIGIVAETWNWKCHIEYERID